MSGLVKSVTLFIHNYGIFGFQSGDLHVESYPQSKTVFDEKGNLLEEITFTRDGAIESRVVHTFDSKGFIVEELYYSEEGLTDRRTFDRQADGRLIREFKHYLDGSYDTISYTYNESGQLAEKVTIDEDDLLESRTIVEYQDSHQVTEKVMDGEGELTSEIEYKYDEHGHLVEQTEWNSDNDNHIRLVDEYNEDGIRTKSARYINGKLVERIGYTHDGEGRVDRMEEENEQGGATYKFVYDKSGNVILQEEADHDGNVISKIERTYDQENRIVESKVSIDGQGRRTSQYYSVEYIYEFMD